MAKKRLDQILVERGFYDSRQKAQTAIMSNFVKVNNQLVNKAGTQVNETKLDEDPNYILVEDKSCPYVGRGAYKLEKAMQVFDIDFKDKVVMDVGASTGGFTDLALQNGASKVIAIDVGKGQLDYKLRNDERVLNLEETNIRSLNKEEIKDEINLVVLDLSFISIIKVLDVLKELSPNAKFMFLIKPQFEAGKSIVDKCKGIIKDDQIRQEVLDQTLEQIQNQGFKLLGLEESPIKGAKGNIEFISYFELNK